VDGVRAETVAELLQQAEGLLKSGHLVAAAVLAGGALESHLRHLCTTHSLTWAGAGSIATYDAAVAQARNLGNTIYSATDTKCVIAWGGLRNDAAHSPTTFSASESQVQLAIDGILQFIARVA
jgi:hypothetical protein